MMKNDPFGCFCPNLKKKKRCLVGLVVKKSIFNQDQEKVQIKEKIDEILIIA